jgi:hypothetical protein
MSMAGNSSARTPALSPATRRFLDLLREIHHGRIERLHIRGGEPVLDPRPRIVRRIKFGPHQTPLRGPSLATTELKHQARDLLKIFRQIDDGEIDLLEVVEGLPFLVEIADSAG